MNLKELLIVGIVLIVIDFGYLTLTKNHFAKLINTIQNSKLELDYLAVGLCYITLVFGLYYFIIRNRDSPLNAALLGFVIYMVFDTTNKAVFKDWDWITVFMDGIWGGVLFGLTTFITYKLI
jgi:uncharacterized membrane protein